MGANCVAPFNDVKVSKLNKDVVLRLFGGRTIHVAEAIGCSRQSISEWRVDKHGNLLSREICDAVLAAMVRANYAHRAANPDGMRWEFDESVLDDLMRVPARVRQRRKQPTAVRRATKVSVPPREPLVAA